MRTENEIREQIKYLETPNEIAGLPVDGSIAASWLKWVLNAEQGGNVPAVNACPQLYDVRTLGEAICDMEKYISDESSMLGEKYKKVVEKYNKVSERFS